MRILVIEDYAPLRDAVVQALREQHYAVDATADGADGYAMAAGGEYGLVVLDLMLPGLDGLELLERLRDGGEKCHVIVLTAKDTVDDRVTGLDLGADDYLIKPFAMDELLARARALLRREHHQKTPVIVIGPLELDTSRQQVVVGGKSVALTSKEYALLEYLAARVGQVVSRMDIWQHVYDDRSEATSNVVDVYIGYLRKKLEQAGVPRLIHTRRGMGYVLSEEAP